MDNKDKVHPTTKQTLQEFLAEQEEEFLSEIAIHEEQRKARSVAYGYMQNAIDKVILVGACSVHPDDFIQSAYKKRVSDVIKELNAIAKTYDLKE